MNAGRERYAMAYLKPNQFVQRLINPLAVMSGMGRAATPSVAGRRTGAPRKVPVIPVEHEGSL
jgi:hypothetical protein